MIALDVESSFLPGQTGHYATQDNPLVVVGTSQEDGLLYVVLMRTGAIMGVAPHNLQYVTITGDAPDRAR